MTDVRDESQAYEYAEPVIEAFALLLRRGPPVPPVDRKDQMRIAMKQMGTRMDLVIKRYRRLLGCM